MYTCTCPRVYCSSDI
uniref:Uncharacterized protein n=1 Tax=Anguilla anguilla TaxID=7936 RepID=A0A0E9RNU7_ANGAN